jgi:glycosyltransferase involved in cell wall biosynthesis
LSGRIERHGLTDLIHFTGYARFEDLPAIYNLGEFFVFPSLYEGFGLPVVEAMASGIPVITSSTSSLGEIAADAAETIDPTSTDAITGALVRLATDAERRRDLADRGRRRAQMFSWTQTAREMLTVYHRAAGVATAPVTPPPIDAAPRPIPVKSMSREQSL